MCTDTQVKQFISISIDIKINRLTCLLPTFNEFVANHKVQTSGIGVVSWHHYHTDFWKRKVILLYIYYDLQKNQNNIYN